MGRVIQSIDRILTNIPIALASANPMAISTSLTDGFPLVRSLPLLSQVIAAAILMPGNETLPSEKMRP